MLVLVFPVSDIVPDGPVPILVLLGEDVFVLLSAAVTGRRPNKANTNIANVATENIFFNDMEVSFQS